MRLAPYTARNYGVVGDALIELGRYDEAFRTFDRMSSLRPDLSSYSRVSYARELLGRPDAASRPWRSRSTRPAASPSRRPGSQTQLGKLAWSHGRVGRGGVALPRRARRLSRLRLRTRAARARPGGEGPPPRRALARAARRRRRCRFRRPSRRSATSTPDTAGRARRGEQYALVDVIQRLLAANGVRTDLEIALFDVDHGVRLGRALAARAAGATRAPEHRRRRRARVGAGAERPLRRGASATRGARSGSARTTRSSSSTAG